MVDALLLLMNTAEEITGPINLGNPFECTILELAQRIVELTGSRSQLVSKELPTDDPQRRRPDISLANRGLRWQPKVLLEEGLPRTIAYFDDLLQSRA